MKVLLPILMVVVIIVVMVVECSPRLDVGDEKPPNIIFLLADDMVQ